MKNLHSKDPSPEAQDDRGKAQDDRDIAQDDRETGKIANINKHIYD